VTFSNSRQAYQDCYTIFDKALDDPVGVRVAMPDEKAARWMRNRLHRARLIHRQDNAELYDQGHPMHNASPFDVLVVRIKEDTEGGTWLYIERGGIDLTTVESLADMEPSP